MSLERMPNGRNMETSGEKEDCPNCNGTGKVGVNKDETCARCKGTGKRPSAR